MERNDDRSSSGAQSFGKRGGKGGLEVIELLVNGNPQRLKNAGGGVRLITLAAAAGKRFGHSFDQFSRCPHGPAGAAADNRAGNRPAGRLFAVAKQEVRQLGFLECGEEFRGRLTLCRVETHVEQTGRLKAKTATGIGQLIGGKPQVEQNAVDPRDSELIQDLWQLRITGLPQGAARVGKTLGRPGEHQGIAIKSDEFSGGTEVFEEDAAVAAGSDRPVDDDQPWLHVEKLDDFPHEDGPMNGRALVSRGPRRIRHCDEW